MNEGEYTNDSIAMMPPKGISTLNQASSFKLAKGFGSVNKLLKNTLLKRTINILFFNYVYLPIQLDAARILKEIQDAIKNPTQIHPLDQKRVARIFYKELQTNGWYGMDEVEQIVNSLHSHSEFNKEQVLTIAHVIQMLQDQP